MEALDFMSNNSHKLPWALYLITNATMIITKTNAIIPANTPP